MTMLTAQADPKAEVIRSATVRRTPDEALKLMLDSFAKWPAEDTYQRGYLHGLLELAHTMGFDLSGYDMVAMQRRPK